MTPSRTWRSEKGSIIRCSRAMRRIHLSDLIDMAPRITRETIRSMGASGVLAMKGFLAALLLTGTFQQASPAVPPVGVRSPVVVRFETALGRIDVEVDPRAPRTAANFL